MTLEKFVFILGIFQRQTIFLTEVIRQQDMPLDKIIHYVIDYIQ